MKKLYFILVLVVLFQFPTFSQDDDSLGVAMEQLFANMFGGSDVKVDQLYNFDHNLIYKIVKRFEGDTEISEEQNIRLMFSENTSIIGVEFEEEQDGEMVIMHSIFDPEQGAMINLIETETEKAGMTMKMPRFLNEQGTELILSNTGEQEKIMKAPCTKYSTVRDDETIDIWLANDGEVDFSNTLRTYMQMASYNINESSLSNGLMMKSVTTQPGALGTSIETMELIETHLNDPKLFITEEYIFINLMEELKREMENSEK